MSSRLRKDGTEKLCTGFLHKDNPTWLDIDKFPIFKSAPKGLEWRLGKPMPECWDCWRARRGQNPKNGWISREEAWPVFSRLISLTGNKQEACRAIGAHHAFLSRRNPNFRGEVVRRAERAVAELEAGQQSYHGKSEPEIVDPQPFGQEIEKWINDWEAERPSLGDYHREFMGPIEWLHEKTGINERRIYAFRRGEIPRIPLSQADALLQAMNLTHLLGWTIEVKLNPLWSLERYREHMRMSGCV